MLVTAKFASKNQSLAGKEGWHKVVLLDTGSIWYHHHHLPSEAHFPKISLSQFPLGSFCSFRVGWARRRKRPGG